MVICALPTCRNDSTDKSCKEKGIVFNAFGPNDSRKVQLAHLCRRTDKEFYSKTISICSEHFEMNDYMHDIFGELIIGPFGRPKLQRDALPHRNLGVFQKEPKVKTTRSYCSCNRKRQGQKMPCAGLSKNASMEKYCEVVEVTDAQANSTADSVQTGTPSANVESQIDGSISVEAFMQAKTKLQSLEKKLRSANEQLATKQTQLTETKKANQASIAKMHETLVKQEAVLQRVRKVLSPSQLQRLTVPEHLVTWSSEDLGKAMSLRKISRPAYQFLLRELNWPLPSEETLTRWISNIPVEPEHASEVPTSSSVKVITVMPIGTATIKSIGDHHPMTEPDGGFPSASEPVGDSLMTDEMFTDVDFS